MSSFLDALGLGALGVTLQGWGEHGLGVPCCDWDGGGSGLWCQGARM